jgi:adenine phosphoribosyltransferase
VSLLERHVELFNAGVRIGDFTAMLDQFTDDAELRFEGVPAGPFVGRRAIADAYASNPPDDAIVVLSSEEGADEIVARYAWRADEGRPAGRMIITPRDDRIARLIVTFESRVRSPFHDELVERARVIDGHADVLGMLVGRGVLRRAAAALAGPFASDAIDKVAALEARGFVLGAAVALELDAGFVAVRKPGGIHPGPKARVVTKPSWRGDPVTLELQRAAITTGERVLVVDDWAETGSQALAAKQLIEECGGDYAGLTMLVDQLPDDLRAELAPVFAVAVAAEFR